MAKVVEDRGQYCVAHDLTGQILKRKGKRVCFSTRKEAEAEARATRRRIMRH
ncbi:hypothetical protein LCGC14_1302420 [marine sediment metagenome]|uniref:AP2/ERF domain-containing protein n=1 Tax=marine sediment metagenome TaxID=412755 RepID=A0A0F9N5S6_9ZZZZ